MDALYAIEIWGEWRMNEKSRSCAEPKAQAEAGPLMPMVRRVNMGFP